MIERLVIKSGDKILLNLGPYHLESGRINFLFGESGIGKSLTARILYGIADPGSLNIEVNDGPYGEFMRQRALSDVRRNGFFVFQEASTHFNPLLRIREQMQEGHFARTVFDDLFRSLWPDRQLRDVDALLSIFPRPYRPSGGEKQRMMLAMALARIDAFIDQDVDLPHLFVFDEPTGNLDDELRNRFYDALLVRHRRRPFTALVVTHDYTVMPFLLNAAPDVRPRCNFVEFQKTHDVVTASEFDPTAFGRWLEQLKPVPPLSNDVLLEVANPVIANSMEIEATNPAGQPLQIRKGELAYLKGPSGAGKTTLAKVVSGLVEAGYFRMTFDGATIDHTSPPNHWRTHWWGRRLSMVFQHADEVLTPTSSVKELFDGFPTLQRPLLDELMQLMFSGDESILFRRVRHLSGGEKQRLNLIRAIALGTELVLLDEPFSGVDFGMMQRVVDFLSRRVRSGQSFLIISHQESIFSRLIPESSVYCIRSKAHADQSRRA